MARPAPRGNRFPVAALILVFAVVNVIFPLAARDVRGPAWLWLFVGVIGFLYGQLGLTAIWAVLGPQPLLVRWPLAFLTTFVLLAMLFLGGALAGPGGDGWTMFLRAVCLLPLMFLAVQLPLWILRGTFGCHTARDDQPLSAEAAGSRQFRVLDLLAATTVCAVTLGLARLGLGDWEQQGSDLPVEAWSGVAVSCLVFTLWSAFSTIPCLVAGLVARSAGAAVVGLALYAGVMTVVAAGIIVAVSGGGFEPEALGLLFSFHGGLALVLFGSLRLARAGGYRLRRPGRRSRPAPAGESPFAEDPPETNGEVAT